MRKSIYVFLLMAISLLALNNEQAYAQQQSDYEITESFKARLITLKNDINQVMSVKEVDAKEAELNSFVLDFTTHKNLIDNALYPSTFEGSIEELRAFLRSSEHRLLIIENQSERLGDLSLELSSFKNELQIMARNNDSLRASLLESEKSEERLSGLLAEYRKNLEKRDIFILQVIDSVLIAYEDIQNAAAGDVPHEQVGGTLVNDRNILSLIHTLIDENTNYLDERYALGAEDYLRMYSIQKKFSLMWSTAGEDLTKLYGGKKADSIKKEIDEKLLAWESSISERTWASVTGYLEGLGFEVPPFNDKDTFFASLNDYIDAQSKVSAEDGIGATSWPLFQDFKSFWTSTVKGNWAEYVQESDMLTLSQISQLDSKLSAWEEEAKPQSYKLHLLLGFALVLMICLVYIISRQRKHILF